MRRREFITLLGERRQHPVLLERKDGTLVACYC